MKCSLTTVLLSAVVLCSFSCQGLFLGVVPLAIAGAVGLKLYFGMKLLGGMAARTVVPLPEDEEDDTTPPAPVVIRSRRAARGGGGGFIPELNPDFMDFILSVDDENCFVRFFCELGANRSSFGRFGQLVAAAVELAGQRESWYMQAMTKGRKLRKSTHAVELCPSRCNSTELHIIVKYVEDKIFKKE